MCPHTFALINVPTLGLHTRHSLHSNEMCYMVFYSYWPNKIHGQIQMEGTGFTLFMAYFFYLLDMWLKSCSSQIPFIPQRAASYHIINYLLVPCFMWIWKTHFTQVRNANVHLVAKFGDGLGVKFVRTPTPLIFPLPTFCLLFRGFIMCTHCRTLNCIHISFKYGLISPLAGPFTYNDWIANNQQTTNK